MPINTHPKAVCSADSESRIAALGALILKAELSTN